jgi:hypothetical protein
MKYDEEMLELAKRRIELCASPHAMRYTFIF